MRSISLKATRPVNRILWRGRATNNSISSASCKKSSIIYDFISSSCSLICGLTLGCRIMCYIPSTIRLSALCQQIKHDHDNDDCVDAIATGMESKRLQLNPDKTEVLWCATSRRQHQLPSTGMLIDGVHITPVKSVRDLGVYIDADLSMRMHVQKTVSCCFAAIRQLRQIRRSVPSSTFQKLVVAMVHSRLDYGNGVLVGSPAHLMRRLQSVLNAAARLIFNLKRSGHITDALVSLHWL